MLNKRVNIQYKIKNVLEEITMILNTVGEKEWYPTIVKFAKESEINEYENKNTLISDIIGIYGGMGSFSDLVLYKNGSLLKNENTRLNELRNMLYELIIEYKCQINS